MYSKAFTEKRDKIFEDLCKGKTQQKIIKFIKKFIEKKPSKLNINTFIDFITKSDEIFLDYVLFVDCFERNSKSFKLICYVHFWSQKNHIKYKQAAKLLRKSWIPPKNEILIWGITDNLILKGWI